MNQPSPQPNKKGFQNRGDGGSGFGDFLTNRSMPESLEAEAAVLGSMMIDPECIGQVVQQVRAEAFYRGAHQILFDAVVGLWENIKSSSEFDLVVLRDELKKRNHLEEIGGAEYLRKVAESVPSSGNIEHYVRISKKSR